MKKQKTREDAFNWILENFSVDGAAGRIISNILEYADDLSEEVQVEFMNKMLDGTIGLTEDEIDNLCWNAEKRKKKRQTHSGTAASVCRKSPAGAGLFLIDMVEWARVMKDAGTRENGSRSGRVRSHRPTGAEGAFAAKDRCSGGLHTAV